MNLENQPTNFDLSNESAGLVDLNDLLGGDEPKDTPPADDLLAKVDETLAIANKAVDKEEDEDLPLDLDDITKITPVVADTPADVDEDDDDEPLDIDDIIKPDVNFKEVIKNLWGDDVETIIQEDENGEEVEVNISDLDITQELFEEIVGSKLQAIEDTYKDRISTDHVSDFTQRLIDIEKNGGDVKQALDLYEDYQDPLEQLDMSTEAGQAQAVIMKLRAKGTPDDEISDLLDVYVNKGVLEEKGVAAKEDLDEAVQTKLQMIEQQAIDKKAQHKQALKQYKTEFKETLQTFNVKDSVRVKIVNAATKTDDKGAYELDKAYNAIRKDPAKAAELAFYLLDRGEFVKLVSEEAVTQQKKTTVKKLRLMPNKAKKTLAKQTSKGDSDLIDINDLIN